MGLTLLINNYVLELIIQVKCEQSLFIWIWLEWVKILVGVLTSAGVPTYNVSLDM